MTKTRRSFFTLASAGVLALGLGAVPVFATSFGSSGGGSAGGFLHHKSGGGSSGGGSRRGSGGSSITRAAAAPAAAAQRRRLQRRRLHGWIPPPQERRRLQRRRLGRRPGGGSSTTRAAAVPAAGHRWAGSSTTGRRQRRRLQWRILLRSCSNQHGPGGTVGKLVRPAKRLAITAGGEDGTTLPAIPVLLVPTNGELNREFASSLPGVLPGRGRPKESQ